MVGGGGRRKKLRFSKIYSFRCGRAAFKEDHSQIGGPGFSRVVYCNDPDCFEAGIRNYADNYVRTTKYTLATFLPKSLFEQFRRVANFFFLVTGILSFTPLAPYSAISAIIPLIIIVGGTMVKEAVEDWRRRKQVNFFFLIYLFFIFKITLFCLNDCLFIRLYIYIYIYIFGEVTKWVV